MASKKRSSGTHSWFTMRSLPPAAAATCTKQSPTPPGSPPVRRRRPTRVCMQTAGAEDATRERAGVVG